MWGLGKNNRGYIYMLKATVKKKRLVSNRIDKSKGLAMSFLGITLLTTTLGLVSCGLGDLPPLTDGSTTPAPVDDKRLALSQLSLQTAADCTEFKQYVSESLIKRYTAISPYYGYGGSCQLVPPPQMGGGSGAGGAVPTLDGVVGAPSAEMTKNPDATSSTNTQEQGVDEADTVKVDTENGNTFIAHGRYLIIADAFPPTTMNKLAEIDLQANILNLFYDQTKKRIIALTRDDQPYYILAPQAAPVVDSIIMPIPVPEQTMVHIYEFKPTATNAKGEAVLIDKLAIAGYYQDSRRIGDRLHLITRHNDYLLDQFLHTSAQFSASKQAFDTAVFNARCDNSVPVDPTVIAANPAVVAAKSNLTGIISGLVDAQPISSFLPTATRTVTAPPQEIPDFLSCTDVHFPTISSSLGYQIITSMDSDGKNVGASALVNNSWMTYASTENLYLAENSYKSNDPLDSPVVVGEPQLRWFWPQPTYPQMSIHKVALSATARPLYRSSGVVDGHANNSFQFSEHNGVLRVTTTQRGIPGILPLPLLPSAPLAPPPASVNHLTLLRDNNAGVLEKISEIRDLAPNETIQSTRFVGNRAYMVTFRQIDPLFTFDLTDPTHPLLKGELKIPGFSTYMHVFDENHLLTIGRDGNANGTGNNMQLQLINVADLTNPYVVGTPYSPSLSGGSSWSTAEYDHHAFTFFEGKLAIPLQTYSSTGTSFSGVLVVSVDLANGFRELGRVDHANLAREFYCPPVSVLAPEYSYYCDSGQYIYLASPRRSVFQRADGVTYLYTISDVGMKANDVANLKIDINSMTFPPQYYFYQQPVAGGGATGGGGTAVTPGVPTPIVGIARPGV